MEIFLVLTIGFVLWLLMKVAPYMDKKHEKEFKCNCNQDCGKDCGNSCK